MSRPDPDRTYLFARHARAVYQSPTFRAEAFPAGTDWPLSDDGEAQARELGRALAREGCERIVSSGLLRARRTAEIASAESGVPYGDEAWPELNEISPRSLRHHPATRGRPQWWEGIVGAWELRRHVRGAPSASHDVAPIERRIRDVLARLDALPERRIAVVSHGYFIFLLSIVVPGRARPRPMRNVSITRVVSDGRGIHRLQSFAEPLASALDAARRTPR